MRRPWTDLVTAAAAVGTTLLAAGDASSGAWTWCIYSPTTETQTASLASSFIPIVGGWVDNAWDTQRRRGLEPTTRTTWS